MLGVYFGGFFGRALFFLVWAQRDIKQNFRFRWFASMWLRLCGGDIFVGPFKVKFKFQMGNVKILSSFYNT